jgi:integration host factor subunit beta
MIKSELVAKIKDKYPELYQRDADLIVNTIFNEISEALARGDRVEIRGFGSFNTKETQARVGRNPKSGQKIPVQEKIKPVFRAGKELKLRINQE